MVSSWGFRKLHGSRLWRRDCRHNCSQRLVNNRNAARTAQSHWWTLRLDWLETKFLKLKLIQQLNVVINKSCDYRCGWRIHQPHECRFWSQFHEEIQSWESCCLQRAATVIWEQKTLHDNVQNDLHKYISPFRFHWFLQTSLWIWSTNHKANHKQFIVLFEDIK